MNNLEEGLRLIATGCAMSYGLSFTAQCTQEVYNLIYNGVLDLQSQGETDDAAVEEAERELIRLVSALAKAAKGRGRTDIGEDSFAPENFARLPCPLPPWVKEPCP